MAERDRHPTGGSEADGPGPAVAFLIVHSHDRTSYLHDHEVSLASGALRARGIASAVLECTLPTDDPEAGERALADLRAALAGRYRLVVLNRAWSGRLISRLTACAPEAVWLYAGAWDAGEPPPVDVWARSLTPGLAVEVAAAGRDRLDTVPGVRIRRGSGFVDTGGSRPDEPTPVGSVPDLDRQVVNRDRRARPARIVLAGAAGCPYAADIRRNRFFDGLDLDPGLVSVTGCSFCSNRGRPEKRSPGEILAAVERQLDLALAACPAPGELVLLDQQPFRWLVRLIEGLNRRGLPPLDILLQARADRLLREMALVERAAGQASRGGHRLCPYLVGIENFSQPELDRFNKGVTVETLLRFLDRAVELERRQPAFSLHKAAWGFILFTPWTTMDDLETNRDLLVRTRFTRFRGQAVISKLRLHPGLPLYWRARADGLLLPAWPEPRLDMSARYGYEPESPWRFVHPETDAVCRLLLAVMERQAPADEAALLAEAIGFVRRRRFPAGTGGDELADAWFGERTPPPPERRDPAGWLVRALAGDGKVAGWTLARVEAGRGLALTFAGPGGEAVLIHAGQPEPLPGRLMAGGFAIGYRGRPAGPAREAARLLAALAGRARRADPVRVATAWESLADGQTDGQTGGDGERR